MEKMCSRQSPLTEVEREIGTWIINVNERSGGTHDSRSDVLTTFITKSV